MSIAAVKSRPPVNLNADDSYDRYKRPRWQPVLLLVATSVLMLALKLDVYNPRSLMLFLIPSTMLSLDQRVNKIMSLTPLIAGHDDLAERVRYHFGNQIYGSQFESRLENGGMPEHFDLPRLKSGNQGGLFWNLWVNRAKDGFDLSNENSAPVVVEALAQVDVYLNRRVSNFDRHGKLLSPIGLEGLHMIGGSASILRLFQKLGTKFVTLTSNCHNACADAAQVTVLDDSLDLEAARPATPYWDGLSPLGTKIIHEVNRLGMIIDLSHSHPATMHDVMAGNATKAFSGSRAPVIFSHSSAYALCPHPRNVPDHILPLVKQTGSVVMVTFFPQLISCINSTVPDKLPTFYPANSTLEWVAEHIMYIGNKIGFEHVGIGSDFDGTPSTPQGLEDVSKFPNLVKELLRRGLKDKQVGNIIGGNLLRVWKMVEDVSKEMQIEGVLPMEDDV